MAEKGFNLKILVPADDGVNISLRGIRGAKYRGLFNRND